MTELSTTKLYPRRQLIRGILRGLIRFFMDRIATVEIIGLENIPTTGPLIVVGNHFNFLDPVMMIRATPWPLEFIGGENRPNSPAIVRWIPDLWGILPVWRGEVSRDAINTAQKILNQNGVLGVFPEGGSWAKVLRPARLGVPLLATSTNAQILPIGFEGGDDVFPYFRQGKRAVIRARIGKPFGPFFHSPKGLRDREKLEEIGHLIMREIATLIEPEHRGIYSDDPNIREAAREAVKFPWDPK